MYQTLGNPEEQSVINVTDVVQTITLTRATTAIEFQNTGVNDIYFGKASTLTSDRGGVIYGNGTYKKFENLPSNWKISFLCSSGQTSVLRRIDYI